MIKQIKNYLTGLLSFIFVIFLIGLLIWTVSPVDDVKAAPDTWRTANPMSVGRTYHTAALLQNGLVFVMGVARVVLLMPQQNSTTHPRIPGR